MRRNLVSSSVFGYALIAISALTLTLVVGCSEDGPHRPVAGANKANAKGGVGYDSVRPIFAGVCAKCHPGQHGPDWLDFSAAHNNAQLLMDRVVNKADMPPKTDPAAALITQQDRDLIGAWVAAGAPEKAAAVTATSEGGPAAGMPSVVLFNGKILSPFVQSCAQCHGTGRPSANAQSNVPHIAGLNREYLLAQLLAFRSGVRIDPTNTMNQKVASPRVKLDELDEAADYYASLEGLRAGPKTAPVVDQPQKFEAGRTLARRSCVQCHANPGPNDISVPLLSGQSEEYLTSQLKNFKHLYRTQSVMATYAAPLSESDIENLAYFFSVMPTPAWKGSK